MGKRISLFSLMAILWTLLLTGCNPIKPELPNNEIVNVMKNYADSIDADYSNIKETNFDWYNVAEYDYVNYDEDSWYYNITWYEMSVTWLSELPNTNKIFDWWYAFYMWDAVWSSYIEYYKDNIVCSNYQWFEQEVPYELLGWEWDYGNEDEAAAYDKAWDDFYKTVTYEVDLNCGYIPEWALLYKDFYYNAEWMEPFWYASIRWSTVTVFNPEWMIEEYITNLKLNWDNVEFKWYNVDWKLEKVNCVDGGRWGNHEYKISFDLTKSLYWEDWNEYDRETTHYEWCADAVEFEFIAWEEWTIDEFSKKANYVYTREFDHEYVSYTISDIIDNYVSVFISESDWNQYDWYEMILEKVDDEWRILFEWDWYDISPDECERLNQYDNNLMDMFFLRVCPRG